MTPQVNGKARYRYQTITRVPYRSDDILPNLINSTVRRKAGFR